jgi:hypothetical protein
MKTRLSILFILVTSFMYLGSSAQSYYYIQSTGTEAAYNFQYTGNFVLNTTSLSVGQGLSDTLSSSQSIGFPWNFYGQSVSSYKISDNGYITFNTNKKSFPNNISLPDTNAPKNSIFAFWDALVLSKPDATYRYAILNWTYGTAPNRVHVIQWFEMHGEPVGSSTTDMIFAVRLYESGSKSFDIVFNYIYTPSGSAAVTTATVGCQNADGTVATMVNGSPNYTFPSVPATANTDDVVYEFYYGTQPAYDLSVTNLTMLDVAKLNAANNVTGEIKNYGTQTINSFTLKYKIDGNTTSTPITATITSGSTYTFNASTFTPTTGGGQYHNIKVWADGLNGSQSDENNLNDTANKNLFYNQGISAVKRTLIEEFTTVQCGYCPEGHLILEQILENYPNIIGVCHHAGFGTDAMTISAHSTYAAVFADGAPTAAIDRYRFTGDPNNIAISRNVWETSAVDRLNVPAPCAVQIYGTYDDATKSLSATFDAKFVDYPLPGDLRITMFVVEDHVSVTATDYNQHSYFYNTVGHTFYQKGIFNGSYAYMPGYDHRQVVREVLSPVWGTTGVIPTQPAIDQDYSKTYTATLNSAWNSDSVYLVGFVSYYDLNTDKRTILNSFRVYVKQMPQTIQAINDKVENKTVTVYPNPVIDIAQINFSLDKTSQVSLEVFNTLGQKVQNIEATKYTAGNQTIYFNTGSLEQGAYIGILKVDGKCFTTKFVK